MADITANTVQHWEETKEMSDVVDETFNMVDKIGGVLADEVTQMGEVNFEMLDKFSDVLTSVEKQITLQSSFLETINNVTSGAFQLQQRQLDINTNQLKNEALQTKMEEDRLKDDARKERLNHDKQDFPVPLPVFFDDKLVPRGDPEPKSKPEKEAPGSLGALLPGIGTFVGSLLGTGGVGFGAAGAAVFRGGLVALIAEPLGNFVGGAAKVALEDMEVDPEFATSISDSFGNAVGWGALGLVFGKKVGLAFAAGSVIHDMLDKSLDENQDGMVTAFGKEFDAEKVANIGGIIGASLAIVLPSIIMRSMSGILAKIGIGSVVGGAAASATGSGLLAGAASAGAFLKTSAMRVLGGSARALTSLPGLAATLAVTPTELNKGEQVSINREDYVNTILDDMGQTLPQNPSTEQVQARSQKFNEVYQEVFPLNDEQQAQVEENVRTQRIAENTTKMFEAMQQQAELIDRMGVDGRMMTQFNGEPQVQSAPSGQNSDMRTVSENEAKRIELFLEQNRQSTKIQEIERFIEKSAETPTPVVIAPSSIASSPTTNVTNHNTTINNTNDPRRALDSPSLPRK